MQLGEAFPNKMQPPECNSRQNARLLWRELHSGGFISVGNAYPRCIFVKTRRGNRDPQRSLTRSLREMQKNTPLAHASARRKTHAANACPCDENGTPQKPAKSHGPALEPLTRPVCCPQWAPLGISNSSPRLYTFELQLHT